MQPLSFVSVYFQDGKGVLTGPDGSYSIDIKNAKARALTFSYVGYKKVVKQIIPGKEQHVNVLLEPGRELAEIVIKTRKRGKYRNKNNPAVELIDLVIENKNKNRMGYDNL